MTATGRPLFVTRMRSPASTRRTRSPAVALRALTPMAAKSGDLLSSHLILYHGLDVSAGSVVGCDSDVGYEETASDCKGGGLSIDAEVEVLSRFSSAQPYVHVLDNAAAPCRCL